MTPLEALCKLEVEEKDENSLAFKNKDLAKREALGIFQAKLRSHKARKLRRNKEVATREIEIAKSKEKRSFDEVDAIAMDSNFRTLMRDIEGTSSRGTAKQHPNARRKAYAKEVALERDLEKKEFNAQAKARKEAKKLLKKSGLEDPLIAEAWSEVGPELYHSFIQPSSYKDCDLNELREVGYGMPKRVVDKLDLDVSYEDAGDSRSSEFLEYVTSLIKNACKGAKRIYLEMLSTAGFIYQLYNAKDLTSGVIAIYQYIMTLPVSIGLRLYEFVMVQYDKISDWFVHMWKKRDEIVVQSASDVASRAKSFVSQILTGPIATFIKDLILSLASYRWFSKDVASAAFAFMGKPSRISILSLLETCADGMIYLLRFGECFKKGVPFTEILIADDPISKCDSAIRDLLYYKDKTYTGLPVEGRICVRQFIMECTTLISTAEHLVSIGRKTDGAIRELHKQLLLIKSAKFDIVRYSNTHMRAAPVSVLLYGDPGVGKSTVINFIYEIMSHVKRRKFHHGQVFTRVKDSDYLEGLDPLSQPFYHYSEVGNQQPKIVSTTGDKIFNEFCSMGDGQPYVVNTAFGDKGKVCACPELIMMDTNCPDLNLPHLVKNEAAFWRRIILSSISVLPEFRKEFSTAIDSQKSLDSDRPPMDRWAFTIKIREPTGNKTWNEKVLLSNGTCYQYAEILSELFRKHVRTQERVLEQHNKSMDMTPYLPPVDYISESEEADLPIVECKNVVEKTLKFPRWGLGLMCQLFWLCWSVSKAFLKYQWDELQNNWSSYVHNVADCFRAFFDFMTSLILYFSTIFVRPKEDEVPFVELLIWTALSLRLLWWDRVFIFVPIFFLIVYGVRTTPLRGLVKLYYARKGTANILKQKVEKLKFHLGLKDNKHVMLASDWYRSHSKGVNLALIALGGCFMLYKKVKKHEVVKSSTCTRETNIPMPYDEYANVEIRHDDNGTTIKCSNPISVIDRSMAESKTTFPVESKENVKVNELENIIDCGGTVIRRKIGSSPLWNLQTLPSTPALHKDKPASLGAVISRNVRAVEIHTNCIKKQFIFGLCENFALINTHALGTRDVPTVRVSSIDVNSEANTVWLDTDIEFANRLDLGNDISIIRLGNVRFRDIMMHLTDIDYPSSTKDGWIDGSKVRASYVIKDSTMLAPEGNIMMSSSWRYPYENHYVGMCGLPLVIFKNSGSCVAGIHCAAQNLLGVGHAAPIDKASVVVGIAKLKERVRSALMHSEAYSLPTLEAPIKKSMVNFEVMHGVSYLGKLPGDTNVHRKSRIAKTLVHDKIVPIIQAVCDYKPEVVYGPPVMEAHGKGSNYKSPWNNGVKGLTKQRGHIPFSVMDKVADVLFTRLSEGLIERGVKDLSPISMEDAINGVDEDDFISRINASTAGGYGFPGKKHKFIPKLPNEDPREVNRYATDDLCEAVTNRAFAYLEGRPIGIVHNAALKDEARSVEKIRDCKTRIFYPTPLDSLVLARMMLSPFYSLVVQHCDLFSCAIGINMHADADAFITYMHDFSPYFIETDVKEWDVGLLPQVRQIANNVLLRILKHFGYNEEALKIVSTMLDDMSNPIINILNDLIVRMGHWPSGNYATAEENSRLNVIMMMIFWYLNPNTQELHFFDYVQPGNYGDDMLAAVKEAVIKFFNNITYRDFCVDVFKIEVTPGRKGTEMTPYVTRETCTFLKRSFVYNEEFGRYLAPLEMDSIVKSLMWAAPSQTVTPSEQMCSTLTSAVWELALHFSREAHGMVARKLNEIFSDAYNGGERYSIPTYDEIMTSICEGSEDVLIVESFTDSTGEQRRLANIGLRMTEHSYLATMDIEWLSKYRYISRCYVDRVFVDAFDELRRQADNKNKLPGTIVSMLMRIDAAKKRIVQVDKLLAERHDGLASCSRRRLIRRLTTTVNPYQRATIRERLKLMADRESCLLTIARLEILLDDRDVARTEAESDGVQSSGAVETLKTDQNFVDVVGAEMKEESAGYSVNTATGQANILDMADYLSRPVEIYSTALAMSYDLSLNIDVWTLFLAEPTVRAKLRNHAYLRGNMNVRISVSATPFHYGCLLASYQPFSDYNQNLISLEANIGIDTSFRPMLLNYLSQAEGSALINVNENKPVEILCPFISTKPMFRLFNNDATAISAVTGFDDVIDTGSLYLYSINQIKAISATASPIYMQIYAWMTEVELGTNTATQIAISTEARDERKTGPIESIATRVALMSNRLMSVPAIAPYAQASSMVAEGVAKVAAIFGWAKPILNHNPQLVKNVMYQNGANVVGTDTAYKVTLDPMQELTVDPRVIGVSDDQMTLSHISARTSYFDTFAWNDDSKTLEDPLWTTRVAPAMVTQVAFEGKIYTQPTALAYAALPFQYWRGDIIYRFQIVCSKFHRGKLAFYFEPNIAQMGIITPAVSLNKQFIRVVDIQETQDIEVSLNWASYRSWLLVQTAQAAYLNHTDPENTTQAIGYCNGFLSVVPFTALQSPDASDISINVYAYSNNIAYNGMCSTNLPTERILAEEPEEKILVEALSSMPSQDVTVIDLNPSTATLTNICEDHFGEMPLSFRSLLKRYVTNDYITQAITGSAVLGYYRYFSRIFPKNNLPYGATTAAHKDLFTYLYYAYVGVRGGIRYRFSMANINSNSQCNALVSLVDPTTSFATTSISEGAGWQSATVNGTVSYNQSITPGIEFELPYYSSNLYQLSFSDSLEGNVTDDVMCARWYRNFVVDYNTTARTAFTNAATVQVASGEDFQFMRFQGAPYYTGDPII